MEIINARCRKIKENDLKMIMDWRMLPEITKYLNTNPHLTMEGQYSWFQKIKAEEEKSIENGRKAFYWILEVDETPAGFVSLVNADNTAKKIGNWCIYSRKGKTFHEACYRHTVEFV